MKIFGLTVGRNEEHRYLEPMLKHSIGFLDDLFFFDDQSDDMTPFIANGCGAIVETRPPGVPSFVENEGAFREAAWKAFEYACAPRIGDWVLINDCDEVLVSYYGGVHPDAIRHQLMFDISAAGVKLGVNLNIPEVFGFNDHGQPLIRKDRLWGTIHFPRLIPYRPNGQYSYGDFGVPPAPSYVMSSSWGTSQDLALMHYGYAREDDQTVKYQRYIGHSGHSNAHVESITYPDKELVLWGSEFVEDMR